MLTKNIETMKAEAAAPKSVASATYSCAFCAKPKGEKPMLIDEVKAALANYAVYDAGDWQELVLKVLPKLVAAEELAQAIADNAWRTDAEKAALAAYRRTEGETKAND